MSSREFEYGRDELTRAILAAVILVLRRKGVLSDADAEAVAAEAFDIIRPPLLPDQMGGPEQVEAQQHEALEALQRALAQTSLPTEFLPLPR